MWNDTELQYHVEKAIGWEPSVHTIQIGIIAKDGAIQLLGHVETFWEKCAAERAAWRVAHVKSVTNNLRVELPFHAVRADDDIALAAMGILEWNCLIPESVEVEGVEGWVILNGTVESQHQKEEAERALRPLRGIRGIRNEILIRTIVPAGDPRPPIEEAFKRSALVHTNHIKVHVSRGVVRIDGCALSRAAHDEAVHAAWAAPGITAVEDHIIIGSARS